MHLKVTAGLLMPGICALAVYSCSGDMTPRTRNAASLGREADSVIAACRRALLTRPDDADALTRCAQAMLDDVTLHDDSFRNLAWNGPDYRLSFFKYIGHRPDRASIMAPIDSLRAAASYVARAIALDRENAAAWRTMGRLDMALGTGGGKDSMYEKATAAFDTSLFLEPASAEGYRGLGCALYSRHRTAEAVSALNLSIAFDSTSGPAYLTLGEALKDTGNFTVAFACFENAARLGLARAGDYIQLARHYDDESSERRLLGRFASLRRQAPSFLKPTVRAALRMGSMYHPAIALDLASRAIGIDSTCAEAHLLKASIFVEEGDTAAALDEYMEALTLGTAPYTSYGGFPAEFIQRVSDLKPDDDALMYLLGQPYIGSLELAASPRAIARYRKAAEERPGAVVPVFLMAQAYALLHDTARAIEWFDRLASLPPEPYPGMYWRAQWTYLDAGKIDKAVSIYQHFMTVDDEGWIPQLFGRDARAGRYPRAKLRLAASYCMVGFECSWRSGPGRPAYWKEMAAEQFNKAIRIVPESYVPYYAMASMYDDIKDRKDAGIYYRKAAALGSTDAMGMLERLGREK